MDCIPDHHRINNGKDVLSEIVELFEVPQSLSIRYIYHTLREFCVSSEQNYFGIQLLSYHLDLLFLAGGVNPERSEVCPHQGKRGEN